LFFVFPYHFGERGSSQEGGQHAQNTTTTWANRMEMSSADHQRKEKEVGVTKSQFPFFKKMRRILLFEFELLLNYANISCLLLLPFFCCWRNRVAIVTAKEGHVRTKE
jgi:hypothetical protein